MLFCAMSTINITNYFCLEALNMTGAQFIWLKIAAEQFTVCQCSVATL